MYNRKIVRIRANLYWFMHGFYLRDANCSDEFPKKPDEPNWNYYDRRAGISFDERTKDAVWEKLTKYEVSRNEGEGYLEIVATGRFLYRQPCADGACSDHILDRVFFEFQISDLHSVKPKRH